MAESNAEPKHASNGNGKALSIIHSILVAVLIGLCGWTVRTVIKNREDIIALQAATKAEEKKIEAKEDEMLNVLRDIRDHQPAK